MARPKTIGLTPRQADALAWTKRFIARHGIPPTVREIGEGLGIGKSGVFELLQGLEEKGALRRGKLGARSLIVEAPEEEGIPILGRVAAGTPLLAEENPEGRVTLDPRILRNTEGVFAVRATGRSMEGAGILDGDLIFVRKQQTADPGNIVVALVDGGATVKRFRRRGRQAWLDAANPDYPPIRLGTTGSEDRILGKVVATARTYHS